MNLFKAIQQRVDEINAVGGELFDILRPGDTVTIHSGPFVGYEAIFDVRLPGTERIRVLLKLLRNRQMPVDLPAGQVCTRAAAIAELLRLGLIAGPAKRRKA